jgi:hypothetical protein
MIDYAMARKLLTGAANAASLAAAVARHVAWYVNYQVHGTAKAEERPPPEHD